MDDRSAHEQERRDALPEHEYRPPTGVGGGVDPGGTAEEAAQVGDVGDATASPEEQFDPHEVPPVTRSG
jgi:hypothetical protein